MSKDEKEATLETLYAQMDDRLEKWLEEHPKANLTQMEDALDAEFMPLRALMLEKMALKNVKEKEVVEKPTCNKCGEVMHKRGKHTRHLVTTANSEINLEREYYSCPNCKTGFFPPR